MGLRVHARRVALADGKIRSGPLVLRQSGKNQDPAPFQAGPAQRERNRPGEDAPGANLPSGSRREADGQPSTERAH